ncbi:unnamed protein product [Boreogadus saida]
MYTDNKPVMKKVSEPTMPGNPNRHANPKLASLSAVWFILNKELCLRLPACPLPAGPVSVTVATASAAAAAYLSVIKGADEVFLERAGPERGAELFAAEGWQLPAPVDRSDRSSK